VNKINKAVEVKTKPQVRIRTLQAYKRIKRYNSQDCECKSLRPCFQSYSSFLFVIGRGASRGIFAEGGPEQDVQGGIGGGISS
jgi:hypothetical protein